LKIVLLKSQTHTHTPRQTHYLPEKILRYLSIAFKIINLFEATRIPNVDTGPWRDVRFIMLSPISQRWKTPRYPLVRRMVGLKGWFGRGGKRQDKPLPAIDSQLSNA